LAFCAGVREEAKRIAAVLRSNGFEVYSVICKTGSVPKEELGITNEEKVRPGSYEPMCNPIGQAKLLSLHLDCTIVLLALFFKKLSGVVFPFYHWRFYLFSFFPAPMVVTIGFHKHVLGFL